MRSAAAALARVILAARPVKRGKISRCAGGSTGVKEQAAAKLLRL